MSSHKPVFTDDFKEEAVRLALTSGRRQHDVADDLGIGKSTLGKWIRKYRHQVEASPLRASQDKELVQL